MRTLKSVLVGLSLGVVVYGGPAWAVSFFPPITGFQDDDLDFFINNAGSTTTIDVGDRLVSIVEVDQSFGVFGGGPSSILPDELTGILDITVIAKVSNGDGTFDFVFGPTVGGTFGNADADGATTAGAGTGTMVKLFLDGTPDLTIVPPNCASLAACTTAATDGALWAEGGFTGDANEFWVALNALDTPGTVLLIPASTKVGTVNFGINVITNGTGQTITPQFCFVCPAGGDGAIDVIGSGDLLGGQGFTGSIVTTDGLFARSDFDFQIATVPGPASLLLLGAGLLGFRVILRRRQ